MKGFALVCGLLSVFASSRAMQKGARGYRVLLPSMEDKECFFKIPINLAVDSGAQIVTHPKVYRWKVIEDYILKKSGMGEGFSIIRMIKRCNDLVGVAHGLPDYSNKHFYFFITLDRRIRSKVYKIIVGNLEKAAYAINPEYKISINTFAPELSQVAG